MTAEFNLVASICGCIRFTKGFVTLLLKKKKKKGGTSYVTTKMSFFENFSFNIQEKKIHLKNYTYFSSFSLFFSFLN